MYFALHTKYTLCVLRISDTHVTRFRLSRSVCFVFLFFGNEYPFFATRLCKRVPDYIGPLFVRITFPRYYVPLAFYGLVRVRYIIVPRSFIHLSYTHLTLPTSDL